MKIDFNISEKEIETIYNLLNVDIPKNLNEESIAEDLHYLIKILGEEYL